MFTLLTDPRLMEAVNAEKDNHGLEYSIMADSNGITTLQDHIEKINIEGNEGK